VWRLLLSQRLMVDRETPKFADLLTEEPPRDELEAAYLNAPQSL
jgi:hypothetical protein